MIMHRQILIVSLLIFSCYQSAQSQISLDEEIGFKYVKAEYLYETGRYEDCIKEYNDVIQKAPDFKSALIKRASAKYALGAYKGAKEDAMLYMSLKGVDYASLIVLSKSDYALGNLDAALNSVLTAASVRKDDVNIIELKGLIYEQKGDYYRACMDFQEAIKMGSASAQRKAMTICPKVLYNNDSSVPPKQDSKPVEEKVPGQYDDVAPGIPQKSEGETAMDSSNMVQQDSSITDSGAVSQPDTAQQNTVIDDPTIPKPDDYRFETAIDEDLSVQLYGNGLGRREITKIPSMLVLVDDDGQVCVDICVDPDGKVTKAVFNQEKSTILKKGYITLALKKAQEFTFEPSVYKEQCGFMVFKVKRSQ
jgi:predicted negative regulator of RcsB-dependent stress response